MPQLSPHATLALFIALFLVYTLLAISLHHSIASINTQMKSNT